jgi:hypothetical protein
VNDWIRESGGFDDIVDFDRVLRDRSVQAGSRPATTVATTLHPNDDGYRALAETVPLSLLWPLCAAPNRRG